MKFVTWIEAILVVTLVTLALAAAGIARKAVEKVQADNAPQEAAYLVRQNIDPAEQALARAKDESTRVHTKLVDAHAEALKREADVAAGAGDAKAAAAARAYEKSLAASLAQADERTRKAVAEHSRRRKAAGRAFDEAKKVFEHNTRVDAYRAAGAVIAGVFLLAFIAVSLPAVRGIQVHRSFVFGAAAVAIALAAVYEWYEEPGAIAVAALVVLALVIAAAATAAKGDRG